MTLTVPPYVAALLTGSDGAPMLALSNGTPVMTDKQWYLFWTNLAAQINSLTQLGGKFSIDLGGMIRFGTHADRPDVADVPGGAFYFETDRGSLYQNHNVGWQYIGGTMYGTLSPDQRPTDLTAAGDAGFVFKTTDDPSRSFVWNGGQWVETTPARYGTHAERIAAVPAELVSGMLWCETDRSSVLYQLQGGAWQYVAGTMFGTFSPDQRPTDLGPAGDAGFEFKTTDDPARSFIWNGGQWVETTPVRYGTHAERLAAVPAELVDGMLWMETDRGNVMYQLQAGAWLYLSGEMWGTLSPDQRPTDLGLNDTGFHFIATTSPVREFIWDSAAWVETTPYTPDYQLTVGSGNLTLTGTITTVPGMTQTLARTGTYDLRAGVDVNVVGAGDHGVYVLAYFYANGAQINTSPAVVNSAADTRLTVAMNVKYVAVTAGTVITVRAYKTSGTGTSVVIGAAASVMVSQRMGP